MCGRGVNLLSTPHQAIWSKELSVHLRFGKAWDSNPLVRTLVKFILVASWPGARDYLDRAMTDWLTHCQDNVTEWDIRS